MEKMTTNDMHFTVDDYGFIVLSYYGGRKQTQLEPEEYTELELDYYTIDEDGNAMLVEEEDGRDQINDELGDRIDDGFTDMQRDKQEDAHDY